MSRGVGQGARPLEIEKKTKKLSDFCPPPPYEFLDTLLTGVHTISLSIDIVKHIIGIGGLKEKKTSNMHAIN